MLENIAQKVAVSTSEIIGYEVIITDENSIIIGASDTSRLGDLHEASITIIRTGQPNPDTLDIHSLEGTRHGFALPIEFFDKKIGSFGITGKREEVKGYCYLLKEYIETMLYHEMNVKSQFLQEQAVKNLLQEIAIFDPTKEKESYLLLRGQELGYDLELTRIVLVIDLFQFKQVAKQIYNKRDTKQSSELKIQSLKQKVVKIMKHLFNSTEELIVSFQDDKFILIPILPAISEEEKIDFIKKKCKQMMAKYHDLMLSVTIGIGTIAKGINELHQSYKAAWRALKLGKKVSDSSSIYYIYDLVLEDVSSYTTKSLCYTYIQQLLDPLKNNADWDDLAQTICAWCESGFNQKNAASMLYIHRNTLHYRLSKIQQITNIESTNFKKMFTLYLGILMNRVNNNS